MTPQLDFLRQQAFKQSPSFIANTFTFYDWTCDEELGVLTANAISSWAQGDEGYCTMRVLFAVHNNTLQSITVECTPNDEAMKVYVVFDVDNQEAALSKWSEFLTNYKDMRHGWLDRQIIEAGE